MNKISDNLVSLIFFLMDDVNKLPDTQLQEGQVFDYKGNIITL